MLTNIPSTRPLTFIILITSVFCWKLLLINCKVKTTKHAYNSKPTLQPQHFFHHFVIHVCVLWPFSQYFTNIQPMVKQRWAKTNAFAQKPPDLSNPEHGFLAYQIRISPCFTCAYKSYLTRGWIKITCI